MSLRRGIPVSIFFSKEHVMKRHLFLVLALALVLSSCKQDGGGGTPSGTLGDGDLTLGGTVYYWVRLGSYQYDRVKYTTPGTVTVKTGNGVTLDTAALTNGEFNITITGKPECSYSAADLGRYFSNNYGIGLFTFDPPGARCMPIKLTASGNEVYKFELSTSGRTGREGAVFYLYVDTDVTVTLQGGAEKNQIVLNGATLPLSKGWNALHFTTSFDLWEHTGQANLSVGNPNLGWRIDY
jgi:hypothetical protein